MNFIKILTSKFCRHDYGEGIADEKARELSPFVETEQKIFGFNGELVAHFLTLKRVYPVKQICKKCQHVQLSTGYDTKPLESETEGFSEPIKHQKLTRFRCKKGRK
jgi:hypothetical protein